MNRILAGLLELNIEFLHHYKNNKTFFFEGAHFANMFLRKSSLGRNRALWVFTDMHFLFQTDVGFSQSVGGTTAGFPA